MTFDALIAATPFAGVACARCYDDTGTDAAGNENCIAYNVSCTDSEQQPRRLPVAPSAPPTGLRHRPHRPPTACTLTTAYNNSTQPATPGVAPGDPFYSPIDQIHSTAEPRCRNSDRPVSYGECAVAPGQTVNIAQILTEPTVVLAR